MMRSIIEMVGVKYVLVSVVRWGGCVREIGVIDGESWVAGLGFWVLVLTTGRDAARTFTVLAILYGCPYGWAGGITGATCRVTREAAARWTHGLFPAAHVLYGVAVPCEAPIAGESSGRWSS